MNPREIKILAFWALFGAAMIACSCASSSKVPLVTFSHHQTLTSGFIVENDTIFFPNHFVVEQRLDSLDISVRISPHGMQKGDETAVCVWVDGENHADAVVFKNSSASEYVMYRFVVNGKSYPVCFVFLGFPSKHQAHIRIKRVDEDIVFYQPYDREVARIGLNQLYNGGPIERNVRLAMYAIQTEKHQSFTVDFDY